MKKALIIPFLALATLASAQTFNSPSGISQLTIANSNGLITYAIKSDNIEMLKPSELGLVANFADFSKNLKITSIDTSTVSINYSLDRIKCSSVNKTAKSIIVHAENAAQQKFDIEFSLQDNDLAFRYTIFKDGETGSIRVMQETTSFVFPSGTTTFICPQSTPMIGWKRTKPSYEEEYTPNAPMDDKSKFGCGYTFPCLFNEADKAWVLISETGTDSRYCGCHLSEYHGNGKYSIAFPMPEENNGNGTVEPAFALPGSTPWRTITFSTSLKPIVETTIAFDVVEPRYTSQNNYKYGRGTWSWILWQDGSINYDDQVKYIDFAADMNYEYVLIDNWWDKNIGKQRMEDLVKYAKSKNVEIFLWYSSSGYWNDIVQGPVNLMDNAITRKQYMRWMNKIGVKGIKVDFFGGDKQETMRLYEDILSDADDNNLMVIFHGCTLPRGWERMYPNYVGSEAVLASENLIFDQHFCDVESFNATLHPFVRNAVGSMEYGGCFMNKRMHRSNNEGNTRKTTDVFQLATTVLFQNPIQNFALAPNNLTDAPAICMDYLRNVATTWDETRFLAGYPGRYIALARRSGSVWYVAIANATSEALTIELDLNMFAKGTTVDFYHDDKTLAPVKESLTLKKTAKKFTIPANGGVVIKK